MLSSSEKHFIQSWKDQRDGPRWKYYSIYIIAWSTVTFLSLFFLTKLIMSDRNMEWISFYAMLTASITLATLVTHIVYIMNEKKFKKILERKD
ncbi:MAG: hypothetical protein ABIO55_06040 [Ginsengibacter sp.]